MVPKSALLHWARSSLTTSVTDVEASAVPGINTSTHATATPPAIRRLILGTPSAARENRAPPSRPTVRSPPRRSAAVCRIAVAADDIGVRGQAARDRDAV